MRHLVVGMHQATVEEVCELAAALEVQSEHPLAAALLAFAAERLGHAPRADKGVLAPSHPGQHHSPLQAV